MSRLVWDKTGERLYETGVDHAVLYRGNSEGVAWNGLTAVNENPSGAEPTALYADNIKYLNLMSAEEYGASIEAYTYPNEFKKCLGEEEMLPGITIGQQERSHFGLSYRTLIGNDEDGTAHGYKLHLVYDCLASPSEKAYSSMNDNPDAVSFSWDISATPVSVDGYKPTATLTIDSTKLKAEGLMNVLRAIEDALYGTAKTIARLLMPSEVEELFENHMYLRDSNNDLLLDSSGKPFLSKVYE